MLTALVLVRHGRASGHGPESTLLAEGAQYVTVLGRKLAREGWSPAAAFSSPYTRACETATILLGELASSEPLRLLPELMPDHDVNRTLDALLAKELPAGRVLVVAHMPLLARLAAELTAQLVDFYPGTLVEIELDAPKRRGTLLRRIGPEDL